MVDENGKVTRATGSGIVESSFIEELAAQENAFGP